MALFLGLIPTFAAIPVANSILNMKKNKLINSINENFTYKDYLDMQKSGEWTSFVHELSKTKDIETSKSVPNYPRSLNCCIFDEKDVNDENLVQKSAERNKKQTTQNTSRTLYCNILEDENEQTNEHKM